ncbi:MAG TPA: hypothetical protein VGJ30_02630, partial [Candidatus Angelobacter sp.]
METTLYLSLDKGNLYDDVGSKLETHRSDFWNSELTRRMLNQISADIFNEWQPAWIPEDVELWAVKLPGRERRIREKSFRRLPPFVDAVYEAMG